MLQTAEQGQVHNRSKRRREKSSRRKHPEDRKTLRGIRQAEKGGYEVTTPPVSFDKMGMTVEDLVMDQQLRINALELTISQLRDLIREMAKKRNLSTPAGAEVIPMRAALKNRPVEAVPGNEAEELVEDQPDTAAEPVAPQQEVDKPRPVQVDKSQRASNDPRRVREESKKPSSDVDSGSKQSEPDVPNINRLSSLDYADLEHIMPTLGLVADDLMDLAMQRYVRSKDDCLARHGMSFEELRTARLIRQYTVDRYVPVTTRYAARRARGVGLATSGFRSWSERMSEHAAARENVWAVRREVRLAEAQAKRDQFEYDRLAVIAWVGFEERRMRAELQRKLDIRDGLGDPKDRFPSWSRTGEAKALKKAARNAAWRALKQPVRTVVDRLQAKWKAMVPSWVHKRRAERIRLEVDAQEANYNVTMRKEGKAKGDTKKPMGEVLREARANGILGH